jgi:isorenieratene synthase
MDRQPSPESSSPKPSVYSQSPGSEAQLADSPSHLLSRRALLQVFGVGTAAGLLGYSRLNKPKPSVFQPDTLALPAQLTESRSVAVVGGGLAGLACAYELCRRGFHVTLLERAGQLGGKIASWTIEVEGRSLRMEHGFHGFFPQYYNLKSIVSELDARDHFKSLEFYSVVYRDTYQPEVFRPSHSAFPWNIVDLTISSPNRLRWGLNLVSPAHWQVFREITGFHPQKSYDRLDHLSVAEWVAQDFPMGLYDLYFLPFAKSSLNAPDVLSAGELMQFFHFYFFGNPEGLAFDGTRQDMGRSLVQPIVDYIQANQGTVLTGASVSQVQWEQGKIAGLEYRLGNAQSSAPFWVSRNPLLSTDEVEYFGAGDNVYQLVAGSTEALSLSCTHQGCTVHAEADGSYLCPCHGAAYDAKGSVVSGPAQHNLAKFRVVQREGDRLQLAALEQNTSPVATIQADYYVFAADIPGVQHLFSISEGDGDRHLSQQVSELQVADPFAAARFWFDRPFDWEHSDFTSLSGYRLTDSITLYHRIQEDYIAWAEETGGSVVELHAYCYKEKDFPTQRDLLATFEAELYEIVPQLQGATMLHRELVNQKNFAGFPPNSYANRPMTETSTANLMFAGDWVKMPFPCGLMERAVSSGLLAANAILAKEGLQRRALLTVQPQGILQI